MVSKILYWIPRVLTIIAIIFMAMFSIDVFGGNEPLGKKLLGFLVHNIPVFILICVLIIAWKREIIGGILFIIAAGAGCIVFRSFAGNSGSLYILAPFFIAGLLFILHNLLFAKSLQKE